MVFNQRNFYEAYKGHNYVQFTSCNPTLNILEDIKCKMRKDKVVILFPSHTLFNLASLSFHFYVMVTPDDHNFFFQVGGYRELDKVAI